MFGDFDPVFPAADGTPDGASGNHGEDAAEDADEDDPAQVHAQHGRHQHRARRGGNERMTDRQTGQQRDDVVQNGALGALCQRERQRDEDDQTGIEEDRHGHHQTGDAQCPRSFFVAELPHHGHGQRLCATGFFQNGTEHGAKAHQKSDAFQGVADALIDRANDVGQGHPGHQADANGTHQNGDHGVDFEFDDENEQQDQAGYGSKYQPCRIGSRNCCHNSSSIF